MRAHPGRLPPTHVLERKRREARQNKNDIIRELVLEHGRIDILATHVLGYGVQDKDENGDPIGEPYLLDIHRDMLEWQEQNPEGLFLGFRGSRKTTFMTITRVIFEILRDRNVRVLLASDAAEQSKSFLRAVKSHFEKNEKLNEIFGDYFTDALKWADNEIIVNRTQHYTEATVTCVGTGTALLGRHFDIVICDDLVSEDSAKTEGQRNNTFSYFYKTLVPCLLSRGRMWIIGTRWDDEDLYGWLEREDYVETTFVLGVLDDEDESVWEEEFPTKRMLRLRRANLSAFELQWMCRAGVGDGGIFSKEHFVYVDDVPDDIRKWQGVDLAAQQKTRNDFFAHCTVGIQLLTSIPYLISYRKKKMRFPQQVRFVAERFDEHPDTVGVVCEANAYQDVFRQQVKETYPHVPAIPRVTMQDKIARAQQLAFLFTDRPLHVKRGHNEFVRLMRGFPNLKGSKDLFDALELAIGQGQKGKKRKRRKEPGLL